MIRFVEHKAIDRDRWDRCVGNFSAQLPYGFSWWLDLACRNWAGLVLNDYEAVMPLPFKKKLGIKYIYQPFFTQQLGVFGEGKASDFLESIPGSFKHIHLNLNWKNKFEKKIPGLAVQTNLVLDLGSRYDILERKFSENSVRNLKKAEKKNLFTAPCHPDELVSMFRKTRGKEFPHLKRENYSTLLVLAAALEGRKLTEVYGVYDERKELLGGAIFIRFKSRNVFFFSAMSPAGKSVSAMNYLLHHFIRSHAGKQGVLDFEGSNQASLARFYKGFGAREENYFSYRLNRLPGLLKVLKK